MEYSCALGPMLGNSAHLAKARMDARLSCYEITPAQTHTLLYLHHHGGQAYQSELVEHLRVKPSTAAGILDRMEEKELVIRAVCESDARVRMVTLTEKGAALYHRLRKAFDETEQAMLQGLTGEETEQLMELLGKVISNLEEDRRK